MLAGMLPPDEGRGTVLGTDIAAPRAADRARIGYMSQRLALYPDLTVAENLAFRAAIYRLPRSAVAAAVARFGLGDVMAQRFDRLSGGWARRVQFAATVLNAPPLLLLDEPTAGLDVATRRDIWRWLGELAAAGTAIVVSTHDLAEAERCPAILYYADHRATAMSPAELIRATGAASLEAAVLTRAGPV
jgi:ABC-type multidrug transport system ATPase subunit